MSKTVPTDELPSHVLDLLDEHAEFVITKDGTPVARVVPITVTRMRTLEELRGSIRIVGDIMEPVDTEWDVEK